MWLKCGSRFSCGHASATVSKFVKRACHSHRVCRGHLSLLLPPSHPSEAAALFVDLTFLPRDAARAPSIRLYANPTFSTAWCVREDPPQVIRQCRPLPPDRPDKRANLPPLDRRPRPCWSRWVVCLTCKALVRTAANPFDDQRAVTWRHVGLVLLLFRLSRPGASEFTDFWSTPLHSTLSFLELDKSLDANS